MFDVVRDGFQCLTIPRSGRYRFEVIGASYHEDVPGARIIGEVRLEKGEKITVALGQTGNYAYCGSGGTFVVKNGTSDPQPLFVAGGAGRGSMDFAKANLSQTASGNDKIGSSGVQKFIDGDRHDIYCCGAGFFEAPVTGRLKRGLVAPECYKDGLVGGKCSFDDDVSEGGFGGGGGWYHENDHHYSGAGGGYTGGGSKLLYSNFNHPFYADTSESFGGGGGSFSIDKEAKFDHFHEEYTGVGRCKVTYLD